MLCSSATFVTRMKIELHINLKFLVKLKKPLTETKRQSMYGKTPRMKKSKARVKALITFFDIRGVIIN
jgi:hypothetical protein